MAMTKAELEKELETLKAQNESKDNYIKSLKEAIEVKDKQLHNLELIYTNKSASIMDAIKTLYRHLSLELEAHQ